LAFKKIEELAFKKIEELAFTENRKIGFYGKLKNWLFRRKIEELAF